MSKKPTNKTPPQTSQRGYAIVYRPMGSFWSRKLFDTKDEAEAFFDDYWATYPGGHKAPWRNYRIVKARLSLKYMGELP